VGGRLGERAQHHFGTGEEPECNDGGKATGTLVFSMSRIPRSERKEKGALPRSEIPNKETVTETNIG